MLEWLRTRINGRSRLLPSRRGLEAAVGSRRSALGARRGACAWIQCRCRASNYIGDGRISFERDLLPSRLHHPLKPSVRHSEREEQTGPSGGHGDGNGRSWVELPTPNGCHLAPTTVPRHDKVGDTHCMSCSEFTFCEKKRRLSKSVSELAPSKTFCNEFV